VIVNAADIEREPGQLVRFTSDQVRLAQATDSFSLHNTGMSEVLALADALDRALLALIDAVFEVIEQTKGENYAQNLGD
jgi:Ni,Fe-hydrogenase maturation factor